MMADMLPHVWTSPKSLLLSLCRYSLPFPLSRPRSFSFSLSLSLSCSLPRNLLRSLSRSASKSRSISRLWSLDLSHSSSLLLWPAPSSRWLAGFSFPDKASPLNSPLEVDPRTSSKSFLPFFIVELFVLFESSIKVGSFATPPSELKVVSTWCTGAAPLVIFFTNPSCR